MATIKRVTNMKVVIETPRLILREFLTEIGYHLRRDMWGQGLATEAARACRDYGFEHLNAEFLTSLIRPENLASRRVAERNGMKVWKQVMRVGLVHAVYRLTREE